MYATNDFRKGLKIELDKVPFQIVDFQHVSPGKGSAFTRTKLKNMLNGNVIERTFKSGDKVDRANIEQREMQFLFRDSAGFTFMDIKNYEQMIIPETVLGEEAGYLKENVQIQVVMYNDRPIGIELPNFVDLAVAETEPGIRGDTASGGGKPAKLESGAVVNVPFHIKEGDIIRVDTRDGTYYEKVSK